MGHSLPESSDHVFPRQEYWNGLPFSPLGDLPNPGIESTSLASPAIAGRFFAAVPPGEGRDSMVQCERGVHLLKWMFGVADCRRMVEARDDTRKVRVSSHYRGLRCVEEFELFLSNNGELMLEKTLESALDSKEIKPVRPKGNQSWIFIGRTVAETEALILWPSESKSWLIGKDLEAGKGWSQKEQGWQRMR